MKKEGTKLKKSCTRIHSTLMVTDGDVESDESDVSDEEPVGENKEEENKDQSSSNIPED